MGPQSLVIVLAAAVALSGAADAGCTELGLVQGASRPSVRGVVERTPIASNPLPWGQSISAVTRVWGGVVVERWATSGELRDCLVPVDLPVYEAVGISDVLVPSSGVIIPLEEAALVSQFGPPVVYEPSGFDRLMAWLRVFPSVVLVGALLGWSVVALRRRRKPSEQYLF
ncbi:MAG TPA: hypothetical protein VLB67_10715 [Acidimicrobiia bacterium]|nr:hypothetical protein [Acidimicrobiia bacterium]